MVHTINIVVPRAQATAMITTSRLDNLDFLFPPEPLEDPASVLSLKKSVYNFIKKLHKIQGSVTH